MTNNLRLFFVILIVVVLSGCATTNHTTLSDIKNLQGGEIQRPQKEPSLRAEVVDEEDGKKNLNLPTDPYSTLGVYRTKAISEGKVTIIEGVYPSIRFGEFMPGSIHGYAIAVVDDREYFCQTVIYRLGEDLSFRIAIIIEGLQEEVRNARVMTLSVLCDYAYDLSGKEFKLDPKFRASGEERRKFVKENGTLAEDAPLVDPQVLKDILAWNKYNAPEGILLSPLGWKEMRKISEINPQYKYIDKLQGAGDFQLVMDPIGTMIGLSIDVFYRAPSAPATGVDFTSQLPSRRNMGETLQGIGVLRQKLNERSDVGAKNLRSEVKQPEAAKDMPAKKKTVAEKEFPATSRILAEKIQRLGYEEEISFALARKIEQRKFIIATLQNPTKALAAMVDSRLYKNSPKIEDDSRRSSLRAEKYESGNTVLYRIMNDGREILFRLN